MNNFDKKLQKAINYNKKYKNNIDLLIEKIQKIETDLKELILTDKKTKEDLIIRIDCAEKELNDYKNILYEDNLGFIYDDLIVELFILRRKLSFLPGSRYRF